MERSLVAGLLILVASGATEAQERDATLRVLVRVAEGALPGTADAARDVEEALKRARPGATLGLAAAGQPADLDLWLTQRMMSLPPGLLGEEESLSIRISGIVPGPRQELFTGVGASPRAAAEGLLAELGGYARRNLLLRARPDWPDNGFEFEALSKERRKRLGLKQGAAVVTAVRPDGLAQRAGLAVNDVIERLGGRKLEDAADLAAMLYRAAPGTRLDLGLARGRERLALALIAP